MINFAAENIVEPFNRQRKGHANEYKVSTNPHRVQVTAIFWLQSVNPAGTREACVVIIFIYGQY